jgi:hypothetical protein
MFYIYRPLPTKTDLDAFRAMDDYGISRTEYPYIHRWRSLISARITDCGNELVYMYSTDRDIV